MITSAFVGGYVITLRAEVAEHAREIRGLQEEFRISRELLVRIDENVKDLRARRAGQE